MIWGWYTVHFMLNFGLYDALSEYRYVAAHNAIRVNAWARKVSRELSNRSCVPIRWWVSPPTAWWDKLPQEIINSGKVAR